MKRQEIIILASVFIFLVGLRVFANIFCTKCKGQNVIISAAYASCSYLDCLFKQRCFCVDSKLEIKNCSIQPIKISKVAFLGDRTGIIKEFVNESNTIELSPLTTMCFVASSNTIPAEEFKRPRFPPLPGDVTERFSFHVEWEADTRVTAPIINTELKMPSLPLFCKITLPISGACDCKVIDQW